MMKDLSEIVLTITLRLSWDVSTQLSPTIPPALTSTQFPLKMIRLQLMRQQIQQLFLKAYVFAVALEDNFFKQNR